MFTGLADNTNPRSLASRLRRRRLAFFSSLLARVPDPVTILDVGGSLPFWKHAPLPPERQIRITLLNLSAVAASDPSIHSLAADACQIPAHAGAFDVVFSNSVIEHVGGPREQRRMADEVRRVGKRYFVQTPNRYFPIEPHFVFPLYQFLPNAIQVWLLRNFDLGWIRRARSARQAGEIISGIRLLHRAQIRDLFPGADIFEEKLLGFTKSFIAYGGW
jgi:SAM-dependent methyltransferase